MKIHPPPVPRSFLLLFLAVFLLVTRGLDAAPLSGTKSVGPTGYYASLTAAIADVQAAGNGLGGALILELQNTYVSSVETFPLTIPALNGASATNTLTIRPATGATALVITSTNTTAATVDFNGGQFVTFDGRPGGTGTAKQLTIANTSTSGVAVRFINEGSNNTLHYLTLQGVNTSTFSGTVVFSTTTGVNGNDNNVIDTCDIREGASTPAIGIYAEGTGTTAANDNSGDVISNCNIFNFYKSNTDSAGVELSSGNTNWTVSGNSFYQTASRAGAAFTVRAIYLNSTSDNSHTIAGNFIGGTAPNCGGSSWTTTGTTQAYVFTGIWLRTGNTTATSVQGNTIKNISWNSSSNATLQPGVWSAIYVQTGAANIGTVTGNTVGAPTGTGSISVVTAGNGGMTFGICSNSSIPVTISNNTVGSMTVNSTTTGQSASLIGIQVTAGTNTITNNLVGSITTAKSLNAATGVTSGTVAQQVSGIESISATFANNATITGNTVANLNNATTQTQSQAQIRGIYTNTGTNTISGNTVRNLSASSQSTGVSVVGIMQTSTGASQTVTQNVVYALANTAGSALFPPPTPATTVAGIYYDGGISGTNIIARNLVHSLSIDTAGASSVLAGLYLSFGNFTVQNNMVRLGLDASGASTASASIVYGIRDLVDSGRSFYHNSVFIGGAETSGAANTFAFSSDAQSTSRKYYDNIFVNNRSNSGGTGKHYAVTYGGASIYPGLSANYNIFYAHGTGGVLGRYNGADCPTLASWGAVTGQDAVTAVTDPLFIAPTGTSSTVDLHLQASNPAEGQGIAVPAVTDDFDGQSRSSLTPVDVGADAGNFTRSSDAFPPAVAYPPLTSSTTANRVLTGWTTITDIVGVAGGANAPRLYFKKSTDADVFGGNTSADNGWKYVIATGSGPYSFVLDYSIIHGGSVSPGDTIQYFVVAQDAANNLGCSPAGASASANPPVQNVSSHGTVNSFSIVATISGTVTVGVGGNYPSLSGTGGLFAALNAAAVAGDVVVNIASDLTETGSVTLGAVHTSEYPSTATVTIQPDSATMRTIAGGVNGGLITLNGADRITFDGRFGGAGRFLTFRNTTAASAASTLLFTNDASDNTVRNCVVEGASTSTALGVIGFSTGSVTGNDNNLIASCQVRDLSTAAGVPQNLIGSTGSATVTNSGNTISANELFNFNLAGVSVGATGNDSWTLSGNEIHEINAATSSPSGILLEGGGVNVVSGNFIHDLLTTTTLSTGIAYTGPGTATIASNRITALNVNVGTTNVYGIYTNSNAGATVNVVNNQITLSPAAALTSSLYGLYDSSFTGSVVNAFYNSILLGGTESGTRGSWASYRDDFSTHTSQNNLFLNFRTGGGVSHFAAGIEFSGGSYTASNDVYAGTGVPAANFLYFNSTPVSFATWQGSTGDTNSQAGIAGSGNFTTALFIGAATGDLHLLAGGNVLVNSLGTPISNVTGDYDGDMRNATAPTVGSDEFLDILVEQPAGNALTDGVSIVNVGTATVNGSGAPVTFKITGIGGANLTSLTVTVDGTNAADFSLTQPSTSTLPPGTSTTFTVSFAPTAAGTRNATLHIASNVNGTKNPFDIALTGTAQTVFAVWAASNAVSNDPSALGSNGLENLLNFAFGVNPVTGGRGALIYTGTFAGSGAITATGQPIVKVESVADCRVLFVRRKDFSSAGLTYTVQFSFDLNSWVNNSFTPKVLADDGTNQIVAVSFPPNGANKAQFARLNVTLAP